MIETSQSIKALMTALLSVQGSVQGVAKDSANPFFKNRYASLEAVIETIRKPMTDAGLIFTQAPGAVVNGAVEITTMIASDTGEWMKSTLHVPLAKLDPQGVGSAITYGCRYALMATLGLPPIDDDAEAAIRSAPKATAKPKPEYTRADQERVEQTQGKLLSEPEASKLLAGLQRDLDFCQTVPELDDFVRSDEYKKAVSSLPDKHRAKVRTHGQQRLSAIKEKDAA